MDHSLTEEQRLFADTVRRFLDSECPTSRVRQIAEGTDSFDAGLWRAFTGLGWAGLQAEEQHGGAALGPEANIYLGIVAEEAGRLIHPGPVHAAIMASAALSLPGNESLKQRYLPGMIDGSIVPAWAVCDSKGTWSAASDPFEVNISDRRIQLLGTRHFVESAPLADVFILSVTQDDSDLHLFVPATLPGVTTTPLNGLDITRRYGTVKFDCSLDTDAVITGLSEPATRQLNALALTVQALDSVGALQRVFEFSLEWAFDRYSFGRPLASYQALKHRYADMKLAVEACQATAWAALHAITADEDKAELLARVANAYVSVTAPEVVQDCIQMHGGLGVTWDHDLHLYLRRITGNSALLGQAREHGAAIADVVLETSS